MPCIHIDDEILYKKIVYFLYFRKRMTAHECLIHPWLMGDHSDRTTVLNSSNYTKIRDQIRKKYSDWDSFALPLGRISEYSALRKLMVEKYKIYESSFGKFFQF